jgi:hypothetical protein
MCQNLDLRFFLFYCLFVKFFSHPFSLFRLSVLLPFLLFLIWFFIALCFPPSFSPLFFGFSSLAYSNLLGTKRLGCCCIKRRTISAAEATITLRASKTCHRRLRCASEGSLSMGERAGQVARPMSCHGGGGVVEEHGVLATVARSATPICNLPLRGAYSLDDHIQLCNRIFRLVICAYHNPLLYTYIVMQKIVKHKVYL